MVLIPRMNVRMYVYTCVYIYIVALLCVCVCVCVCVCLMCVCFIYISCVNTVVSRVPFRSYTRRVSLRTLGVQDLYIFTHTHTRQPVYMLHIYVCIYILRCNMNELFKSVCERERERERESDREEVKLEDPYTSAQDLIH